MVSRKYRWLDVLCTRSQSTGGANQHWLDAAGRFKPFVQPLVIDLVEDPYTAPNPVPIKVGFRSGHKFLIDYLHALQDIGVNHVMFSLKYRSRPAAEVIQEIGEYVLPHFPAHL